MGYKFILEVLLSLAENAKSIATQIFLYLGIDQHYFQNNHSTYPDMHI